MNLSISEFAQTKYVTPAFSSKLKYEKLPAVVHVFQSHFTLLLYREPRRNVQSFNNNERVQPLFCSLNLLFGDACVDVCAVICLSPLIRRWHRSCFCLQRRAPKRTKMYNACAMQLFSSSNLFISDFQIGTANPGLPKLLFALSVRGKQYVE